MKYNHLLPGSRLSLDNYYGFSDLNLFMHPFLNLYGGIVDECRYLARYSCCLQLKILHRENLCYILELFFFLFFSVYILAVPYLAN